MFIFRERYQTWNTPAGETWRLCDDLLEQTHLVIGGTTGSGKSTLLHSIMYSALIKAPVSVRFVLIDLKGVELRKYRKLPHTIAYADEPDTAIEAINMTNDLMRKRLKELRKHDLAMYNGSDIYLIIDELAVLMQTAKSKILAPLADIMRLGRAARVHVIGATQNPSRSHGGGLPAEIVSNCTAAVALKCRSGIESRQIVGVSGAESLPMGKVREGIYWSPSGTVTVTIPMTSEKEITNRINYWRKARPTWR